MIIKRWRYTDTSVRPLLYASFEYVYQIENKKTPNFKGYSPLLSGNNNPNGAGDLQEGFEFGWEDPISHSQLNSKSDAVTSGVMAGANVWPSESDVPGFRDSVLQY